MINTIDGLNDEKNVSGPPPRITIGFNFVLFGAWLFFTLSTKVNTIATFKKMSEIYKDNMLYSEAFTAWIYGGLMAVGLSIIGACVYYFLLREFWKRFIMDIFSVRMIERREACALVLLSLFI